MTALACTTWYRPPELWAVTMDDHAVDQNVEDMAPYSSSLDVWSFGAVVYEALSGETLARRAGNGAAMVQAVADVIGACPTQGRVAWRLEYTRGQQWRSWAAAVKPAPSRPLPESGAEWGLVRTCLRWDPLARETMASAKQCAWFAERVAAPEAAPTSQPETCADASTLSKARADASVLKERAHAWLQPDLSPPLRRPQVFGDAVLLQWALPPLQAPPRGQVRLH